MKYLSFVIHSFRGINDPIKFNLSKESIFPLIGINECGKTTILEALLAFDHTADRQNNGKHLADTENLYSLAPDSPKVSAEIEIEPDDLRDILKNLAPQYTQSDKKLAQSVLDQSSLESATDNDSIFKDYIVALPAFLRGLNVPLPAESEESDEDDAVEQEDSDGVSDSEIAKLKKLKKKVRYSQKISNICNFEDADLTNCIITRNLSERGRPYSLDCGLDLTSRLQNQLAKEIIEQLDYILYFDDFRHDVPERISITKNSNSEWTQIIRTLFSQAHQQLDIYELPNMDPRRRETSISKAERYLNQRLTEQWERFHLEDRKSLDIKIRYHNETTPELALEVVETTDDGDSYFFDIKDRSKGFFWFFNFVMRLEFNPKIGSGSGRIIYLLDEPGSYLHARAQDQLCGKLTELSESNKVFFCTHSHHLLNPQVMPFNSIRIVEKDDQKQVSIKSVFDHSGDRRVDAAFQPIFEALQVRPTAFDLNHKKVLVVEGLYDFYAYSLFAGDEIIVVPAVSAHSIQYQLSWLLAWGVDYRALWDNDKEGREKMEEATKHFGESEAEIRFRLLPLKNGKKKRRLENLFVSEELKNISNRVGATRDARFEKLILAAFYHKDRASILGDLQESQKNIKEVYGALW